MKTYPHYRVTADTETGAWISEPEYVGDVEASSWHQMVDTDQLHFDCYEADLGYDEDHRPVSETRAITVMWVD